MVRTYRIEKGPALAVVVFSLAWIGFGIFVALLSLPESLGFLAIGLLPLAWLFLYVEVSLADDGRRDFRSVVRRRSVCVNQITAINADEYDIYIHHQRGKIHMSKTANFDDFLERITQLNPAIELKGWLRDRA